MSGIRRPFKQSSRNDQRSATSTVIGYAGHVTLNPVMRPNTTPTPLKMIYPPPPFIQKKNHNPNKNPRRHLMELRLLHDTKPSGTRFTGFYLVLHVFHGSYWYSKCFCRLLPYFKSFFWIEPSFTGFQRVSFGFTGFYLVLQVPICAYGFQMFGYGV